MNFFFTFLLVLAMAGFIVAGFKDVLLKPVKNGVVIANVKAKAASQMLTKDTVIFVVRRPGWVLCREEALDLSAMKKEGKLGKADLIGIIKEVAPCPTAQTDEELGVGEFQKTYFDYPLYIDEDLGFYKYLGSRSLIKDVPFSWNPFTLYNSFKELGTRLKTKNVEGNYKGEGLTLGGIIIYSKKKGVVFEYKEMTGSAIPKEDIEAAIKSL